MFAHPARTRHHVVARHHRAPVQQYAGVGTGIAVGGAAVALVALVAAPTFLIGPWIVKAFKPEWSYGRRLGASLAFGIVSGTLVSLARAASGKEENTNITLNAPGAGVTSTPATTK